MVNVGNFAPLSFADLLFSSSSFFSNSLLISILASSNFSSSSNRRLRFSSSTFSSSHFASSKASSRRLYRSSHILCDLFVFCDLIFYLQTPFTHVVGLISFFYFQLLNFYHLFVNAINLLLQGLVQSLCRLQLILFLDSGYIISRKFQQA